MTFLRLVAAALLLSACTRSTGFRLVYTDVWNGRVVAEEKSGARGPFWSGGGPLAVAAFARARERSREDGRFPLFLNLGSSLFGSREAWFTQGRASLDFMNSIGFHGMAIGNRDFDLGEATLADLARDALFPFLAANVLDGRGKVPSFARSHAMIAGPDRLSIGITALMTQQMESTIQRSSFRGLHVADPFAAFSRLMKNADFAKADIRILILNAGSELSDGFVGSFARVVAPHVHVVVRRNWVNRPVTGPEALSGVPVLMSEPLWTSAGEYLFDFSRDDKKIVDASWRRIPISSSAGLDPDPVAARRLAAIRTELESTLARVHGLLPAPLPHRFSDESPFGNFVCDVVQEEAQADFAVFNSGGLRDHLEKVVTVGSLFQAIPFDNFLVVLSLTGRDVLALLEESVSRLHARNGVLQLSRGIEVWFDASRPRGRQVVRAKIDGFDLDPKRIYKVATNNFLAEGGDGYGVFLRAGEVRTLNVRVREAVARFVELRKPWKFEKRQHGLSQGAVPGERGKR